MKLKHDAKIEEQMQRLLKALSLLVFPSMVLLVDAQTDAGPAPKSLADWRAMIPAIEDTLRAQFPERWESRRYPVGVVRAADVTGDGIPAALVYLGEGGAYTDELCVMRLSNGKPVVALFKGRAGRLSALTFAEGASVMHRVRVELLPAQHAVFSMEFDYDGNSRKLSRCTGEAFTWNARSQVFDFNVSLTKRLTKKTCAEVPQTTPE